MIKGVINLDMIGYDSNDDNLFEIHSGNMSSSQDLGNIIQSNIASLVLNLDPEFLAQGSSTASDHSSFWNNGYPAIMIIEDRQDFTPFYHTTNDQISSLDQDYFLELSKLAIGSFALLAEVNQTNVSNSDLVPASFTLFDPYPNPVKENLNINFDITNSGKIDLAVYNLLGEQIRIITDSFKFEGPYSFNWDGRTETGLKVPAGLYFIRLHAGNHIQSKKVVFLQ